METASQPTPTKKTNVGRKFAYACGNVGQSGFYNALNTYFVIYVTSAMFVNVDKHLADKLIGIITGLIVVIRIAEIFLDPLLGNLIDNTNTKMGRFRPWQLIGGTVSAILIAVVYSGLFGLVNVNTTAFIVLFVITFIALDVFYSLRDISYWGMIPALSEDSHERSVYTSLGSLGGSIGYNGVTIIVVPIVTFFTAKFTGEWVQGQSGWTSFGIFAGLLGLLTAWGVAFGTKESKSALRAKAQKNGSPLAAFKAIAQNDQLLWVALSYFFYAVANVITGGVLLYLFKYILNMAEAYSIVGVVSIVVGMIAAPIYPVLNKFIPRKFLFLGGDVLMIIAYIIFIMGPKSLPTIVVALIFFYIPGTFVQMTAILGLTDSIEYGQLKNGKRNEAVTLSVRPMIDKIAGAFSNGIVGAIAVAAGMTGTATASDITSSGRATFNTWAFYVPLALIVLSMLTYAFKVKIDEKMHARIVAELEAKLASGEIEGDLESDDENSDDGAAVIEPADIESVPAPAVADMRAAK